MIQPTEAQKEWIRSTPKRKWRKENRKQLAVRLAQKRSELWCNLYRFDEVKHSIFKY